MLRGEMSRADHARGPPRDNQPTSQASMSIAQVLTSNTSNSRQRWAPCVSRRPSGDRQGLSLHTVAACSLENWISSRLTSHQVQTMKITMLATLEDTMNEDGTLTSWIMRAKWRFVYDQLSSYGFGSWIDLEEDFHDRWINRWDEMRLIKFLLNFLQWNLKIF